VIDGGPDRPRAAESVIAGAFHHLPAAQMEDLDSELDADVLIFSDDDDARRRSPKWSIT